MLMEAALVRMSPAGFEAFMAALSAPAVWRDALLPPAWLTGVRCWLGPSMPTLRPSSSGAAF
jgi:hypothetical protein